MSWLRRRTPEERRERSIDRALALGYRGTIMCEEVRLPPGFVPPSAALTPPKGEIIGYEVGGKLYHPADVQIVRAGP